MDPSSSPAQPHLRLALPFPSSVNNSFASSSSSSAASPPPLPPRLNNVAHSLNRRKISLPSLPSGSAHSPNHSLPSVPPRPPPPVPSLPTAYSTHQQSSLPFFRRPPPPPIPPPPPPHFPQPSLPEDHRSDSLPPRLPIRPLPLPPLPHEPPQPNMAVSYTNLLHDHDSPLGPHSIPTRISTRPISFTSPGLPDSSESLPISLPSSSLSPSCFAPSLDLPQNHLSLDGIHHPASADQLFEDILLPSRPSAHSSSQDNHRDELRILTTRPSLDLAPNPPVRRGSRSNSESQDHSRLNSSLHRSGLSTGLSVERSAPSRPFTSLDRTSSSRPELGNSSKPFHSVMDPAFSPSCLSHLAKYLKANVPKGTKIKGSVEYPLSFTGREAVSTLTHGLNRINPSTRSTVQATLNRRLALTMSRRLLEERLFHEVSDLHAHILNDNIDEVYAFTGTYQSASHGHKSSLIDETWHQEPSAWPQGVLTSLTRCYSFACRMNRDRHFSGCYSYDCPNRNHGDSSARRATNPIAATPMAEVSPASAVPQTKDWASVVPKELLTSLDPKEIARQSIIYELISGEQDYVQDLEDYETLFITPLKQSTPQILPPHRLSAFIEKVVSNVLEIRDHNRVLLQNLLIRQQDQHPQVKGIGDIILNSALGWGADYIRYTSDHVFGEVEVNEEKARNPLFAQLLNNIPKQSSRRADFKHYYSRAFVRLQRYNLLLESLLKKTPEGHEDRGSIESAMEVIRRQCLDADRGVSTQQAKLQLVKLNNEIVIKSDTPDLQLLSPNRQLVMSGKMVRKPEGGTGLSEWSELQVLLFDHYLVITKPKRLDENHVRYHIARPPIMLELMRVTGLNEPCERKSRGLRNIAGTLGSSNNASLERGNSDPYSSPSSQIGAGGNSFGPSPSNNPPQDDRSLYPITIHSIGRNTYSITLYVEAEWLRQTWKAKFDDAIGVRTQILDSFKVFDLYPMTDQTFAAAGSSLHQPNPGHSSGPASHPSPVNGNGTHHSQIQQHLVHAAGEAPANMHGPPTCSVPFRSTDGRRLVAIGCMDGLWIGLRNDPSSLRQVIHIKSITQCAVLQEFGFLLVLAEKILLAYPLESLVPSRAGQAVQVHAKSTNAVKGPGGGAIASRLSGNKDVLFFRCGRVGPRTLVIYVKKGGVNQTVFKALEPVKNVDKSKAANSRGFFGLGGQRSESFRGYKEFFVPSESYAIQYLRSTLAIHCARGFEIMNLDTLKTASIPDFHQIMKQHDSSSTSNSWNAKLGALQRRCDECRPLGMFRLGENEFLLCYDEFAFFADKHGDPLVDRYESIIQWDGRPNSVAHVAPHVIGFSNMMIEIWSTLTSKRVQIIIGQTICCTYDGGSLGDEGVNMLTRSAGSGSGGELLDEGERRVHVMMKDNDRFYRVFEMVPLTT